MIEKKFLEEVRKGAEGNFDIFEENLIELIDWAMENALVAGISYTGYSKSNMKVSIIKPRLTAVGEEFLDSFDRYAQEAKEDSFNMEVLTEKVSILTDEQKKMISTLVDNIGMLDEIKSLDEENLAAMKGILLKSKFDEKSLPWETLIKLILTIKSCS